MLTSDASKLAFSQLVYNVYDGASDDLYHKITTFFKQLAYIHEFVVRK